MESQKRYKLFRRFLRENGCSEAFDRNFEAAHPGYILNEPLSCLIGIRAFPERTLTVCDLE